MNHISFAYSWVRATRPQSNPVIKNIFVWGFIQGSIFLLLPSSGGVGGRGDFSPNKEKK